MYIAIGRVLQTHGVQGYVKAVAYSGIPERFLQLKTVYVETDEGYRGFIVEDVQLRGSTILLKLKGVHTKELARQLTQKELFVPETEKIELPEDTYFIHDLIGLKVFDTEGQFLGTLEEVWTRGAHDVYVVRQGKREVLIPAISQFVKAVDLNAGKVVVQLIEGMLEEEENAD
ncbi:MAG: 16S rRNA processing protein RimM [Calditrichaeota bacterium]|nr:16S rRNA processing protein RimM [Calditrichota bacterium]